MRFAFFVLLATPAPALALVPLAGCSKSHDGSPPDVSFDAATTPSCDGSCTSTSEDAGTLPPPNPLCTTNADCDGGVCAYYAAGGCSSSGICVEAVDASALPSPACSCDGTPDPYVANGFTGAPASAVGACVDASAEDGGLEAGLDGAAIDDAAGGEDGGVVDDDAGTSIGDAASE